MMVVMNRILLDLSCRWYLKCSWSLWCQRILWIKYWSKYTSISCTQALVRNCPNWNWYWYETILGVTDGSILLTARANRTAVLCWLRRKVSFLLVSGRDPKVHCSFTFIALGIWQCRHYVWDLLVINAMTATMVVAFLYTVPCSNT